MLTILVALAVFTYFRQEHGYWMSGLLSVPVLILLSGLFLVIHMGSLIRIRWMRQAVGLLEKLPPDLPLECKPVRDEKLPALWASWIGANGEEQSQEIFKVTLFRWRSGAKSTRQVLRSGRRKLRTSTALFSLVTVPAALAFLWVGFTLHWVGFALFAIVPFAQWFIPLFVPQVLSDIVEGLIGSA